MNEEYIVRNCAPTLAGIKTASMFSCPFDGQDKLSAFLQNMNSRLNPKGIRILPLKVSEKRALIYVYRPDRLHADICDNCAKKLLSQSGYDTRCCQRCIVELIKKIRHQDEFPHEIGLFLGYPPEDVRGFMENQAHNQKCTGCWKVYGDVESATKTFHRYHACTKAYVDMVRKGKSIEQLTIAG